jgi:hypothetical protein
MSSWLVIIISLIIFSILMWALISTCPTQTNTTIENWVNYQELPYGNLQTGAGNSDNIRPLVFYNYPIYRRPYNWPVCHLVDYPVPHCRADSL